MSFRSPLPRAKKVQTPQPQPGRKAPAPQPKRPAPSPRHK